MTLKSMTALIVAMGFILVFLSPSYGQPGKIEATGKVTKISGQTVVVKTAQGKEIIVKLLDAKGIKVGDAVEIKDGNFSTFDKPGGKVIDTRKLRPQKPS